MKETEKNSGSSQTDTAPNATLPESTKASSTIATKQACNEKPAPQVSGTTSESKKTASSPSKTTTNTMQKSPESKTADCQASKGENSKSEETSRQNSSTSSPSSKQIPPHNTGNDQVTLEDKYRQPKFPQQSLGSSQKESAQDQFLPPPSSVPPKSPASATLPASSSFPKSGQGHTDPGAVLSKVPPSAKAGEHSRTAASAPLSSTAPLPSPVMITTMGEEQTAAEQKISKERKPLTDRYGTYIAPSDTSLEDARRRLHTALEQTRRLRQAFTDRVYKKYRVCLGPVPSTQETLTRILTDPKTSLEALEKEVRSLNEEKMVEKKEASKLNAEMMASESLTVRKDAPGGTPGDALQPQTLHSTNAATSAVPKNSLEIANAENADQLMFISAGLSLIVLPEHNGDHLDKKKYPQRAPMDPVTGQRVKGISAAAAAAGEVMLDRHRKSAALRAERQRRKAAGEDMNYSRLDFLLRNPTAPAAIAPAPVKGTTSAVPATVKQPTGSNERAPNAEKNVTKSSQGKKQSGGKNSSSQIPTAAAKAIKARVQASMSVQTLLSLSPAGEELRTDGQVSAATLALMERGIGSQGSSKSHHRFRHPYPESAGARGRDASSQDTSPAASVLPPLPSAKERRTRKRLENAGSPQSSERATHAIRRILTQFVNMENPRPKKKKRLSEVSFMHGIMDFHEQPSEHSSSELSQEIDPMLAFHVMQAVGVVEPWKPESDRSITEKKPFPDNLDTSIFEIAEKRAMGEEGGVSRRSITKLKDIHNHFISNRRTLSRKMMDSEAKEEQSCLDSSKTDGAPAVPIRGGGEAINENESGAGLEKTNNAVASRDIAESKPATATSGASPVASPQSNSWAEASRLVLVNPGASPNHHSMRLPCHIPGVDQYHPNAIQLAHQLRLTRMAASAQLPGGDFSEYLGALHSQSPQTYDWSAAATSAASAQSLAALGITPHRTVNFPMQDPTHAMRRDPSAAAAHRHHQALAYLAGSGHGYHPRPGPHFPQLGMNHPSMFVGRGTPHLTMQQQSPQRDKRKDAAKIIEDEAKSKGQDEVKASALALDKESGKKRKLSEGEKHTPANKQAKSTLPYTKPAVPKQESKQLTDSKSSAEASSLNNKAPPQNNNAVKLEISNSPERSTVNKASNPNGLQFFVPAAPSEVPTSVAACILEARCHEAAGLCGGLGNSAKSAVVAYLVAVGTAVPLPRAFIANAFKETFNASPLKSTPLNSIPQASRDVALAAILLWLWRSHEECFQRAFSKSGRVDVDTECKWLIMAAIQNAIASLGQALDDPSTRSTTPLAISLMAIKSKNAAGQKSGSEKDSNGFMTASLDLQVASAISKGLDSGFSLNEQIDTLVLEFNNLLDYLDEARKCALHSKSQERALLAALISRKATMSLSFSHAYVSAMVRAGEALGHGELFEVVQNEEVNVSTMIPYDVFTDETGAWEDPCRPVNGYNASLNGDDLMRQAHARAMIQKSLKKLQERHNIKGGTSIPGAYTDPPASAEASEAKSALSNVSCSLNKGASLKRKPSFSVPPVQRGTGSAVATSWSLYEPKHAAAPLSWSPDCVENNPYGKHNSESKPRSLSMPQFTLQVPGKRGRQAKPVSDASVESISKPATPDEGGMKQSTLEIPWVDVAGIFQNVNLPGTPRQLDTPSTQRSRTIFAPSIREVAFEDLVTNSDDDSDGEEDLSDDMVMSRHQVVLDKMKEHLSTFFDARKKTQQEKRNRRSSKTGK